MKKRKAFAKWEGSLKNGTGSLKLDSVDQKLAYNFISRFEEGNQTNPEELIGAAHAGCYSMALSGLLTEEGYEPESIETVANVTLEKTDSGFKISKSALKTEAKVPGIDKTLFEELAEKAKANCPVSKALSALEITLETHLNT
ncbi:MAG: OsmC family protein [Bacteroidota bacterium]